MAAEPYNQRIDKNKDYNFRWGFYEDDGTTPIDISTWTFRFLMENANGVSVWDITNSGFDRPDNHTLIFTKTIAQMAALDGNYSITFYVTKSDTLNDPYVAGYYYFSE